MRISDWSSDVCSSDLVEGYLLDRMNRAGLAAEKPRANIEARGQVPHLEDRRFRFRHRVSDIDLDLLLAGPNIDQRKPLWQVPPGHRAQPRYGGKQCPRIGMPATLEDTLGRPLLHRLPGE